MRVIRDRAGTLDVKQFLARPLMAHLATASEHGARDSPVWFLWEDGSLWILASARTDSFPGRIANDGRCAVGVVDFDVQTGRLEHVGIRGRGTVERFDRERGRRLLRRYLGDDEEAWDARFRATLDDGDNVLLRITPETIVARDVSYSARG